jgi:hypothetical protein
VSDFLTPPELEARLVKTINRIAEGVAKCDQAYKAKLAALADYDRAVARAYMAHEGPAHEKRYAAELATTTERDARDVADATHRYMEATARSLRDEMEALRSLGASLRASFSAAS